MDFLKARHGKIFSFPVVFVFPEASFKKCQNLEFRQMPDDIFSYFDSFGHVPFIDYIFPRSLCTSNPKGPGHCLICVLANVFAAVFVFQWINTKLEIMGVYK